MIPLALILAAAPVALDRPDHVYIYGSPNRSYECPPVRFYVDTEGFGSLIARECVLQSVDWQWWPDFPLLDITVDLDAIDAKAAVVGRCSFVGHAAAGNGTSSTVIDCR